MKNALNYYYNLNIETIHQKNKNYYFKINNSQFLLLEYLEDDVNEIYNLNIYLTQIFKFHKIILNKDNSPLTIINERKYILLELIDYNNNLTINDIIKINNIPINKNLKFKQNDWFSLWVNKIDYFEYQINQIGKKYPLIRESFNYYIGLAENAISLMKTVKNENIYLSLSHKRINTAFDLYNPLNLIIDIRVRDICEYLKYNFFENKDILNDLNIFLHYNNLSNDELLCFLARMLFPTYYFDLYEKIIKNEIKEEEIKKIIFKANKYEEILKYIYLNIKNNNIYIEWLEKIN